MFLIIIIITKTTTNILIYLNAFIKKVSSEIVDNDRGRVREKLTTTRVRTTMMMLWEEREKRNLCTHIRALQRVMQAVFGGKAGV